MEYFDNIYIVGTLTVDDTSDGVGIITAQQKSYS